MDAEEAAGGAVGIGVGGIADGGAVGGDTAGGEAAADGITVVGDHPSFWFSKARV